MTFLAPDAYAAKYHRYSMTRLALALATGASAFSLSAPTTARSVSRGSSLAASFHDFEEFLLSPAKDTAGASVSFSEYKGKVVLVQNVASL